jgi:N-formylglutamate amidohydrolase
MLTIAHFGQLLASLRNANASSTDARKSTDLVIDRLILCSAIVGAFLLAPQLRKVS